MEPPPPSDRAIIATNDEAFAAKISAVTHGYLADPYVLELSDATAPGLHAALPSRQPMINRGTFARVTFVRRCVSSFIAAAPAGPPPQVVSLGAGFDTLPFLLMEDGGARPIRYVELDFADVVQVKANAVASKPALAKIFDRMTRVGVGLEAICTNGSLYFVSSCDLRDIAQVRECLRSAGIDFSAPTVFISECVLVYMEAPASDALVSLAGAEFSGLRGFVSYEPIEPSDAFGKEMVKNIALRGSPLVGIDKYPSVESQRKRYFDAGFAAVDSMSMLGALSLIEPREQARISRIEMLDEFEEFNMMMSHYSFVWARTGPGAEEHLLDALSLPSK